jgi:CheY-like chemotaxis protein
MILFVDDEIRGVDSYITELHLSGFDVSFQENVDEALRVLEERIDDVDLVILDIMMPPALTFIDMDTQLGLRTGLRFYEKIRQEAPGLPVIILTNVVDERVRQTFSTDSHCSFLMKEECLPFELVEVVKSWLGSPQVELISSLEN